MAAQISKSFLIRLSSSKKPVNLYQSQLIVWMVLSMRLASHQTRSAKRHLIGPLS